MGRSLLIKGLAVIFGIFILLFLFVGAYFLSGREYKQAAKSREYHAYVEESSVNEKVKDDSIKESSGESTDTSAGVQTDEDTKTDVDKSNVSISSSNDSSDIKPDKDARLSMYSDIDGDKKIELVEILQKKNKIGDIRELEGILKISSAKGVKTISFIKKSDGLTSVFNNLYLKDFDGDGCKDAFISIPDSGASFNLNYFFIYNYKTGRSFSYTPDEPSINLAEIAQSFSFKYNEKGKLNIKNENYKYSGIIDLSDTGVKGDEEQREVYNRSWVEPASLEINADNCLTLMGDKPGEIYIKLPLAIFGMATSDIIGKVDVWYMVDKTLTPVLKKLEIYDFNKDLSIKRKVGEIEIKY